MKRTDKAHHTTFIGLVFQMPVHHVNVNVTDTILWQGHHDRVMQLN